MSKPIEAFRSFNPDIDFKVGMKLRHRVRRDEPLAVVVAVGVNKVTLRHQSLISGDAYSCEQYQMAVSANYEVVEDGDA
jgi:uncharacterized protein (UPF0303 family)